jgi:hypothetical protein
MTSGQGNRDRVNALVNNTDLPPGKSQEPNLSEDAIYPSSEGPIHYLTVGWIHWTLSSMEGTVIFLMDWTLNLNLDLNLFNVYTKPRNSFAYLKMSGTGKVPPHRNEVHKSSHAIHPPELVSLSESYRDPFMTQLSVVVYAYNPSTQEVEGRECQVWGQCGLHSDTLCETRTKQKQNKPKKTQLRLHIHRTSQQGLVQFHPGNENMLVKGSNNQRKMLLLSFLCCLHFQWIYLYF